MRNVVTNLVTLVISVLVAAGAGYALCAAAGWNARPSAMAFAAATALVAAVLAWVPVILARAATQAAVAQAALVGTVIHLLGCLAGAAVLLLILRMPAALYWILAFYWATLIALVVEFTRAVRAAPTTPKQ